MLKFDSYNSKEALNREWIVTNGIGGYSSSTISGANTRRYHGLLVASHNPPVQREVLVSKTDDSIILPGGNRINLGTGLYPCTVFPKGFENIESFERTPIPKIVFSVRKFSVCKSIFMVNGSNTTVIEYENTGQTSAELSITPSFVHRDYHNLFKEDTGYDYYYELEKNKLKIHSHYGSIPLYVSFSKGKFAEKRNWIRNNEYIKDNLHHLEEIILSHINGTRYNIHLTEEGFIYGGEGLSQLTWMDARIGDHVVTPRHGCPVEIQALRCFRNI